MKLKGITEDAFYIAIGRAICRKEERDLREFPDKEVLAQAQLLQARYDFVDDKDSDRFGQKALSAFHYAKQQSLPVSAIAAATFGLEEKVGKSPLHDDVDDKGFKGDLGVA